MDARADLHLPHHDGHDGSTDPTAGRSNLSADLPPHMTNITAVRAQLLRSFFLANDLFQLMATIAYTVLLALLLARWLFHLIQPGALPQVAPVAAAPDAGDAVADDAALHDAARREPADQPPPYREVDLPALPPPRPEPATAPLEPGQRHRVAALICTLSVAQRRTLVHMLTPPATPGDYSDRQFPEYQLFFAHISRCCRCAHHFRLREFIWDAVWRHEPHGHPDRRLPCQSQGLRMHFRACSYYQQ